MLFDWVCFVAASWSVGYRKTSLIVLCGRRGSVMLGHGRASIPRRIPQQVSPFPDDELYELPLLLLMKIFAGVFRMAAH